MTDQPPVEKYPLSEAEKNQSEIEKRTIAALNDICDTAAYLPPRGSRFGPWIVSELKKRGFKIVG